MLVYTHQKNIAQVFILERYFFVSIYPAAIPGTYLAVFLGQCCSFVDDIRYIVKEVNRNEL